MKYCDHKLNKNLVCTICRKAFRLVYKGKG